MRKSAIGIFVAIVFLCAGTVFAQHPEVDTKGLTPEQVKALSAAADQLRVKPENTLANFSIQNATPQKFKEWADAGEAAGKAVSAFTKEVGIASDQFIKTDTGRIALLAVIWKLGGDQVVASAMNVVLNFILAVVLLTLWWKMTRRFVFNERRTGTVTYNENPLLRRLGFNKREIKFEKDNEWMSRWDSNSQYWVVFWSRVIAAALLVIITLMSWPSVSF